MKRLYLVLIICYSLFKTEYSFTQWVWQNPYPQGNYLNYTQYFSDNKVMIFGENGTIITTTNGGSNWTVKHNVCDFFGNLNKSQFIGNTGWVVGEKGCVLKTTDGGTNWTRTQIDTVNNLDDLFFLNVNLGYVRAYKRLFKTTNGGINWGLQSTFSFGNPYSGSLLFINENTGWISSICFPGLHGGGAGFLEKTTNGGISWTQQYNNYGFLSTIIFFDEYTGYVAGGWGVMGAIINSTFMITTNSGTNWEVRYVDSSESTFDFNSMYFANKNTGWIADNENKLYKTTNAGINWNVPNLFSSFRKISYGNEYNFWGLNGYHIYKSTNSGVNWISYSSSFDSLGTNGFAKVVFYDKNTGWISNPGFLKTTNGGDYWQDIKNPNIGTIVDFNFLDSHTGWLLDCYSYQYRICKTTDGGTNWTPFTIFPFDKHLIKIGYANFNLIKLIGSVAPSNNLIYTTTNAGINWTMDSVNNSYSIQYINESTGWSVGVDSVRRTTNNGLNWIKINTPNLAPNFAGFFIDQNTGLLYNKGYNNLIDVFYRTSDAGFTWSQIDIANLNISSTIFNYFRLNNNLLWFVARDYFNHPLVAKSSNGGLNWITERPGSSNFLQSVFFVDPNTGWIVGDRSSIFKTTSGGITFISKIDHFANPNNYFLSQNYPNPFNPNTNIKFQIKDSRLVTLKVYDILGKEIVTLVDDKLQAGEYEVSFDGSRLASGIYFYKLVVSNSETISGQIYSETRKMILLK